MFICILTGKYCIYNTCARLNRDNGLTLLFFVLLAQRLVNHW